MCANGKHTADKVEYFITPSLSLSLAAVVERHEFSLAESIQQLLAKAATFAVRAASLLDVFFLHNQDRQTDLLTSCLYIYSLT